MIKVIKNEEKPEPTPILAEAIIKISNALTDLSKNGLNERAIIVLVHDSCEAVGSKYDKKKPTRNEIQAVFKAMKQLKSWYVK